VYGGKDELTGEYCDQLYPINDSMCMRCAKKYQDKDFVKKGKLTYRTGVCRFCGTNFYISTPFVQVSFYAGRNTLKRYSRISQFNDTDKQKRQNEIRLKKEIENRKHRLE